MKGVFAVINDMRRPGVVMPNRPMPQNKSCDELMRAIMEASFFATDLKLYLDTHPDDCRALEMYKEACRQYKACKDAFEDNCYPINACSAGECGTWDWLDGCWPPQRM